MLRKGFTLLELSVVLTIVAIVVAGGLTIGTADTQQKRSISTYDEIEIIDDALSVFLNEYGRLPCPASITLPRTDALFGREATDCADASPPAGLVRVEYPAASGKYVRIGGLPFYSLQMPATFLGDDWNGRYLYAVSEEAITALTDNDDGNITVLDDTGASRSDEAVWVVVSHGPSHAGAYSDRTGATITACGGTTRDSENCDNDGIFTDAVFNDSSTAANFFDDLVKWETSAQIFNNGSGITYEPWVKGQNGDDAGYTLEVKGVTTATFNGGQGYAAYATQCDTDYPGSWPLRSSDLKYINDLPLITTAARLHMDECDHDEETDKTCHLTFSKTIGTLTAITGSDTYDDIDALNCDNWSESAGSATTKSITLERDSVATNFRDVTAADATGLNVATTVCNAVTTFICVGER